MHIFYQQITILMRGRGVYSCSIITIGSTVSDSFSDSYSDLNLNTDVPNTLQNVNYSVPFTV
jgi:hypothetical protein